MKLEHLFDLKALARFTDSPKTRPHLFAMPEGYTDAAAYGGLVLSRNLTAVDPRIFEKQYPELAFMNCGIEANNAGGYAARIQSLRKRGVGGFKTAGDLSADKGHISLARETSYLEVIERQAGSSWSDTELRQADLEGINLVSDYLATHSEIYLRELDLIGLQGIEGNYGLLNWSGFTSGAASGAVETLTGVQAYDEVKDFLLTQWNAVKNTPAYKANVVMFPTDVLNYLAATVYKAEASTDSVLVALRKNFPSVTFIDSARAESVGGSSVTCAFSNNPQAMVMRVPLPLTIGEIVRHGSFDFSVDSKYRIAGLDVLENTAGRLLTGL
jgi:hypothetical protein